MIEDPLLLNPAGSEVFVYDAEGKPSIEGLIQENIRQTVKGAEAPANPKYYMPESLREMEEAKHEELLKDYDSG